MFHDSSAAAKRDPIRSVYAKLDHRVTTDGITTFWFDCIDAAWFDRVTGRTELFPILEAPLAIIAIKASSESEHTRKLRSGLWLKMVFGSGQADLMGDQYLGFQTVAVQQPIASITQVTQARAVLLNSQLSLDGYPEATVSELDHALLASAQRAKWVAAFDVGQGAANALIDDVGAPVIYYDFGGGIMVNEGTFPSQLQRFCFTKAPPIVLSHWDWDHWSSVARDSRALNHKWIVPNQAIDRPVHLQLAADLAHRGNLLIWPSGLSSRTFGPIDLEICTGTTRNDTGLVMWYTTSTNECALLAGDARYGAIPSLPARRPDAIVVPHHGAKCAKTKVPKARGGQADRLVISVGQNNTHDHPTPQCITAHDDAGWAAALRTSPCAAGPRGGVRVIGAAANPGVFPCQGVRCDLVVSKL